MDDAKIEHGEKSFKDIINDIDNGRLKLPPFQRGYVWNSEQIIDLLDSIYNYYPIGSFILWETKEQLSASRNIAGYILPNVDPDWPFYYVLDGQQRISTIYALFSENVNLDNNDDYSPEAEIFDIYYDISRGKFIHKSEIHEYLGHQNQQLTFIDDKKIYEREENFFRLKDLMSKNFRSLTRNFSHHETSKLDDLYNKFHDYPLPCIYIKRVPKNEVAYMFQKINASGTSLDILDLLVAWTWSEDFHLGEEIKTIQERFESDGFSLSWRTLLQFLSGIIFEKVDNKAILALDKNTVKNNLPKLIEGLERSFDYLCSKLNIHSSDFIPQIHNLVGLCYFFANLKRTGPNNSHSSFLIKWFWSTSISSWYRDSTSKKKAEDIIFMKSLISKDIGDLEKFSFRIKKGFLKNQQFNHKVPITRTILLLLAENNPNDLLNGQPIIISRTLSKYNRKECHHIFPKEYLKRKSFTEKIANNICNICLLPSSINRDISYDPSSKYLLNNNNQQDLFKSPKASNEIDLKSILDSNLLPNDIEIYEKNLYEKFLDEREDILMQRYNNKFKE